MSEVKEKISISEIQAKLIERLQQSGWATFLKGFLQSSDFTQIIEYLVKENQEGRRFTPALKQMFRAFEECPVDKVKAVIIGQDCYPQVMVADGIAFSCSNTKKAEASLSYILKAINKTVPDEDRDILTPDNQYDLIRWSHQGVLVINCAFTTQIGKVGAHMHIWKPFTDYLIDMLNFNQSGLVWGLFGKQAQNYEESIGDHHSVFTCVHPAYAAYQRLHEWDCNDIFNRINGQLVDYKKEKILW
jgi:uracil-DNA glycosylase